MQTFPSIHLSNAPFPVALPYPSPASSREAMENWRTLQKRISLAQKLAKGSWNREAHQRALACYCSQAFSLLMQAHKLAMLERKP